MSARKIVCVAAPPGTGKSRIVESVSSMNVCGPASGDARHDGSVKIIHVGKLLDTLFKEAAASDAFPNQRDLFGRNMYVDGRLVSRIIQEVLLKAKGLNIMVVGFPLTVAEAKWGHKHGLIGQHSILAMLEAAGNDGGSDAIRRAQWEMLGQVEYIAEARRCRVVRVSGRHDKVAENLVSMYR